MEIKIFVNNPWGENTVLLYDTTGEAVVIDCGCFKEEERKAFSRFLEMNELKLVAALNTHLHIDHIFGNRFIKDKYELDIQASEADDYLIADASDYAKMMGIAGVEQPPATGKYLQDGDVVRFGESELRVIAVPGHSPGGLCYYSEKDNLLIAGDVLFKENIGRADLPGGDEDKLVNGIRTKLFVLPDDVIVIPGHGPATSIGHEKRYNPYL